MDEKEHCLRKAAEECSELATVLIQQLNKPHKDFGNQITDELGDVIFRIENLKKYYNGNKLTERILYKARKQERKHSESTKARPNK